RPSLLRVAAVRLSSPATSSTVRVPNPPCGRGVRLPRLRWLHAQLSAPSLFRRSPSLPPLQLGASSSGPWFRPERCTRPPRLPPPRARLTPRPFPLLLLMILRYDGRPFSSAFLFPC